jgi:hypothetical protein
MGSLGEQHRNGSYVEKAAAGQGLELLAGKPGRQDAHALERMAQGRADMVTRCRASHTARSGARATREWQIWYCGLGITSSRSMTSSLLHSVPPCLHGTAEGLAAGGAVTVAGSGLIRTPAPRGARRMGTQTRRAPRITGQASPATRPGPGHPPSCRRPQRVCGGLSASLTSISCFTRSRPHEGRARQ